ncbi:uncharacterized protein N7482_007598 [Penicillium canariense]|uniref:Uncharacterized protein n=1 Tax=Penicillium canariense TaxID=189055 RepID=A0A9W9LK97_9EURO|nr:uncharacterized protein N7482_007598 [Penicillium canariense]KAJ5160594.1 hypothetical protein N7482_007598 [Penicillium canariense]
MSFLLSVKSFLLGGCLSASTTLASLQWSPCPSNPALDCATLRVPLEYAEPLNGMSASIPLARYNATVVASQRKGSLLTNPGGPGASGVSFVLNGAGEAISNITGGFYDIIGWDPRGVGSAQPVLQCFATAGEEYEASQDLPAAAEVAYGQFSNQSYMPSYNAAMEEFDSATAQLAAACASYNSTALYTSSAAYVVRDMAAIVDALDGKDAHLNYWGLSYGTIFGVEFIQTYPKRAGKIVLDGVFDATANAETYIAQLPNDQLSVRDAINDLVSFCEQAGAAGCALSTPPANVTADLTTRLANLQESLYEHPIAVSEGFSITVGIFSAFMWSFSRVPTTWPLISSVVSALEKGDVTLMVAILNATAPSPPGNSSAPASGSLAEWPLQCMDNAPSSEITLAEVAALVLNISLSEDTPWLNADVTPLSFCRHFPDTRPRIPNLGASKLPVANSILTEQNTPVLIVNGEDDPVTPLASAERLRSQLPTASRLVTRRGPGHTTVSVASLGLVEAIRAYFIDSTLPTSAVHDLSQLVFSSEINAGTLTPPPVFNGTYTDAERTILNSTYNLLLAFLSLA